MFLNETKKMNINKLVQYLSIIGYFVMILILIIYVDLLRKKNNNILITYTIVWVATSLIISGLIYLYKKSQYEINIIKQFLLIIIINLNLYILVVLFTLIEINH